jgi:hypothetical protein
MMVAMGRFAAIVLTGLAGLVGLGSAAGGCGVSDVFACASDEQCQSGAVVGACQVNGYCSFPDESCPSGQRFGAAAPSAVANACVDPGEGTGTTTGGSPEDGVVPDPDTGELTTTGPAVDSSTSLALDEGGTSTGPGDTTGMDTGSDDATTGGPEPCASIVDEFDGNQIAAMWGQNAPLDTSVGVVAGQLEITVGSSPEWLQASIFMDLEPMTGGWARVLISELDDPQHPLAPGITLSEGTCEVQLQISEGVIWALNWSNETLTAELLGNEPLRNEPPIWLQLRVGESGEVYCEWSLDASTWHEIAVGPLEGCDDFTGPLTVAVRAGGQLDEGNVRTFEAFEACVPR